VFVGFVVKGPTHTRTHTRTHAHTHAGDATAKDRELQHAQARALEAKLDANAAAAALGARSPRPDQPTSLLPWDVLSLPQVGGQWFR
jgi:hypothetical protein